MHSICFINLNVAILSWWFLVYFSCWCIFYEVFRNCTFTFLLFFVWIHFQYFFRFNFSHIFCTLQFTFFATFMMFCSFMIHLHFKLWWATTLTTQSSVFADADTNDYFTSYEIKPHVSSSSDHHHHIRFFLHMILFLMPTQRGFFSCFSFFKTMKKSKNIFRFLLVISQFV